MKNRNLYLIVILSVFLLASTSFAEVDLGGGFKCNGSTILKGTKEVKYSKAKSNIQTTLEKLKTKLESAPKKKKQSIKDQISVLNNSKKQLKACSSGQLGDGEVDPIFTQLSSNGGTFTGTFQGTVSGFPISGTITFQFTLDGTTFGTILTFGGNLASALDDEPLSFSSDVGGIGFPAQFNLPDTFLGSVTLSIQQDGAITITNVANNSSVNLSGQFSNQTISGNLSGQYKGVPFQGSYSLTR